MAGGHKSGREQAHLPAAAEKGDADCRHLRIPGQTYLREPGLQRLQGERVEVHQNADKV